MSLEDRTRDRHRKQLPEGESMGQCVRGPLKVWAEFSNLGKAGSGPSCQANVVGAAWGRGLDPALSPNSPG